MGSWKILFIIFLFFSVAAATGFIIRRTKSTDEKALLYKIVASLSFIVLGVMGFFSCGGQKEAVFIILGQVFGLCGDAFLDMRYVYDQHDIIHTFSGFGSFMAGHICFIIFMVLKYNFVITGLILGIVLAIAAIIGVLVISKLLKMELGIFKTISTFYAGLLAFVFGYSLGQDIKIGFENDRIIFLIGIFLFILSDLVLSQIYFVKGKNTKAISAINHGLYYAAQILIAVSIVFIK